MALRPILPGGVPGCANIPGGEDCQCWPEWTADNAYTFGDVVQQGGVLYYATRDIPPGTAFLAADWAFYRPGATAVPPHNENSTYLQYQPVVYNDKLYTARTDLPPGPFDPANWQEISVEGLIEVVDSETIDFSGTGAAGDPVSADVKLDPDPENLITATANGLILTADQIPFPDPSQILISEEVTLRVDYVTGNDATADGTLALPYATIAAAVGASGNGDKIEIYPGSYTGSFAPKTGTTITAREDVIFTGNITIGAGVSGVLVSGLIVDGDIIVSAAAGNVEFRNVTVNDVTVTGNNTNWFLFDDVNVSGDVTITGPGVASYIFTGGRGETNFSIDAPAVLSVENKSGAGQFLHANGFLFIQNVGTFASLDSTANAGSSTGLMVMSSSVFDVVTGTYGSVTKTGSCRYAFQDFARDNTDNTPLSGPKFLISNGRDVHGNYDPQFYSLPNGQSLNSHFEGIDAALQTLQDFSPIDKLVPVDFGFSIVGGWSIDETLGVHAVTRETIIPANMVGSVLVTDSSTLDGVLNVMVGASVVGTITITDGAAVFASSEFNLDPGQLVRIVSTSEGTFEYVGLTLVGHRQVVYVT